MSVVNVKKVFDYMYITWMYSMSFAFRCVFIAKDGQGWCNRDDDPYLKIDFMQTYTVDSYCEDVEGDNHSYILETGRYSAPDSPASSPNSRRNSKEIVDQDYWAPSALYRLLCMSVRNDSSAR